MSSSFKSSWNPFIGGLILSALVIFLEIYGIPLNIAEGFNLLVEKGSVNFFDNPLICVVIALTGGAFVSTCFSKDFGIKIPPRIEVVKAIFAGILMGIGSALSLGGNIGGFYVSTANLSAGGLTMFAGLIIGTLIGFKYLVWESEKIPSKGGINIYIRRLGIFIGVIILLIILWESVSYFLKGDKKDAIAGMALLFSGIAGFVFHRSRFCMAKAMREPFISGESLMMWSFAVSLVIAMCGFVFLKLAKIQDFNFYILPTFIVSSLAGGILFGLGMILADSCALSMLWKLGEGQLKMFVVLLFFVLSNALFRHYLDDVLKIWEKGYFGKKVFLPDYLTYPGAIVLVIGVILIWLVFVEWNKRTKKFLIRI